MAAFNQLIKICCLLLVVGFKVEAKCGIKSQTSRVAGGSVAKQHEWPWMVQIINTRYGPQAHRCGGALISPRWIVTGRNCFDSGSSFNFKVVIGEHDRLAVEGYEQEQRALRIIKHRGFSVPTLMNNDIALVELAKPVYLSSRVSPICLPSQNDQVPVGARCVTAGWGLTSDGSMSRYLKGAEMKISERSVCQRSAPRFPITQRMICAVSAQASNCRGDAGNPLMCEQADGSWVLQGVASFGGRQCLPGDGNVFTRISQFRDWIKKNAGI